MQVQKIEQWIARSNALSALKQDARFQQDMRDPAVRALVDAVIDDPNNVLRVRSSPAMACLDKLRRLRDVNKRHGGGAINLEAATKPWTEEDAQRAQSALPARRACLPLHLLMRCARWRACCVGSEFLQALVCAKLLLLARGSWFLLRSARPGACIAALVAGSGQGLLRQALICSLCLQLRLTHWRSR